VPKNEEDDYNELERLINLEKQVNDAKEEEWKHQILKWFSLFFVLVTFFSLIYFVLLPLLNVLFLSLKSANELADLIISPKFIPGDMSI